MLAIPTPAEFVTVALIVVVPPVRMTGLVVESVSWADGIGGPIVLSIAFVFVAVRPLYVTFAVAVPEPWINGTVQVVLYLPFDPVVPVKFAK